MAGIEMKLVEKAGPYSDNGAMIVNNVIAARPETAGVLDPSTTRVGIVLPYKRGLTVDGVVFINFDEDRNRAFGVTTIQVSLLNVPWLVAELWAFVGLL